MRTILALSFLTILAGCVNQRTTMINDQGDRLTCEASGFGLFGSLVADSKYDKCVSEAKTRGYRLEKDPR